MMSRETRMKPSALVGSRSPFSWGEAMRVLNRVAKIFRRGSLFSLSFARKALPSGCCQHGRRSKRRASRTPAGTSGRGEMLTAGWGYRVPAIPSGPSSTGELAQTRYFDLLGARNRRSQRTSTGLPLKMSTRYSRPVRERRRGPGTRVTRHGPRFHTADHRRSHRRESQHNPARRPPHPPRHQIH